MGNKWRQWAWGLTGLDGTDKFVIVALADICHDEGSDGEPNDVCFPSVDTLAAMTGRHEKTVKRALDALADAGLIAFTVRMRWNGSSRSNTYQLIRTTTAQEPLDDASMPADQPDDPGSGPPGEVGQNVPNGQDVPKVGQDVPKVGQDAPPLTKQGTEPLTKEEGADVRPLVSFDDFIDGYDKRGLREPIRAQKVWDRMPMARQVKAVRGLEAYNAMLRKEAWKPPLAAHNYLRNAIYEDYQNQPEAQGRAKSTLVKVLVGSPQWAAWVDHESRVVGGKPHFVSICNNNGFDGWRFPSEWPPGEAPEGAKSCGRP